MPSASRRDHNRRAPARGVHLLSGQPAWVFLAVCAENRAPWLAQPHVHDALHQLWRYTATAWLVSDYVLMPDHLHLFCAPHDTKFTIEHWIGFWKDRLVKQLPNLGHFQPGGFHHRLRDDESYADKWRYVLENPIRAGLVPRAEDWPYTGRVHDIRW